MNSSRQGYEWGSRFHRQLMRLACPGALPADFRVIPFFQKCIRMKRRFITWHGALNGLNWARAKLGKDPMEELTAGRR